MIEVGSMRLLSLDGAAWRVGFRNTKIEQYSTEAVMSTMTTPPSHHQPRQLEAYIVLIGVLLDVSTPC